MNSGENDKIFEQSEGDENIVVKKQRKEKKELTKKFTLLKHALNENDKKGKKELLTRQAAEEAAMNERHKKELAQLKCDQKESQQRAMKSGLSSGDGDAAAIIQNKVSKAQKRRVEQRVNCPNVVLGSIVQMNAISVQTVVPAVQVIKRGTPASPQEQQLLDMYPKTTPIIEEGLEEIQYYGRSKRPKAQVPMLADVKGRLLEGSCKASDSSEISIKSKLTTVPAVIEKTKYSSLKLAPTGASCHRRRIEHKEQRNRECYERVFEMEAQSCNNERHKEREQLEHVLSVNNLTMVEIPADGDCLYNAVSHQLSLFGEQLKALSTFLERTINVLQSDGTIISIKSDNARPLNDCLRIVYWQFYNVYSVVFI
uniref:OTU domain-containing protein n=1 Tax=Romanomermis culicivorax TaxID=13658 RepID=A0A915I6U2_ROMCU